MELNRFGSLPQVFAQGTNYECGFSVGQQMRDRIQAAIARDFFQSKVKWANETKKGTTYVAASIAAHEERYPHLVEEIHGLADGADVPFLHVFVRNIESAVGYVMNPWDQQQNDPSTFERSTGGAAEGAERCTDYMRTSGTFKVWGHNEDGPSSDKDFHYIVHQRVEGVHPACFTAYAYAGMLPGWAWGFNNHLGFSINALLPHPLSAHGNYSDYISIEFVTRQVLSAASLEEAVELATVPQAVGASYNMAEFESQRMVNFETAEGAEKAEISLADVWECPDGVHAHANIFLRLKRPEAIEHFNPRYCLDSQHRVARAYAMPPAENIGMVLDVLGDVNDEDFPIYRKNGCTLATVVFDVMERVCHVWLGNGKGHAEYPDITLNFDNAGPSSPSVFC